MKYLVFWGENGKFDVEVVLKVLEKCPTFRAELRALDLDGVCSEVHLWDAGFG